VAEIHDARYGQITLKRHFKAKYVRLSVAPGGTLSITAPIYTPIRFIKRFIDDSSGEIDQLLTHHRTVYRDGDTIGKSHRLKLVASQSIEIAHKKPLIIVGLPPHVALDDHAVQQLLKPIVAKALRVEAQAYLPRRLAYLAERGGFSYKKTYLSHAKSRWGSCSSTQTISLNIALMKLDFQLIDYVIVHELTHTAKLNHSPGFWQLVQLNDPDYKAHRKALKQHSPHI